MGLFQNIDFKLINFSNNIGAQLSRDRPEYPEELKIFEERRIDWIDDGINKAIIIQPDFEINGVNKESWNFILFAWYNDANSVDIPRWIEILISKKNFNFIESQIDKLLEEAIFKLNNIEKINLK
ncbi:hypothetical protein [Flavihumibacter cheonanensis]|uniref:hypothetical protein n=1 Tax=Flavihumibacter cheonanensis TaxID=1442385 RepID=UPI001EF896A7|nr:hypothetical protein [Flavihumibacter cheonanensis]MCG7754803.1 hypothetical protein [Flavihumibacter cheonanensis]